MPLLSEETASEEPIADQTFDAQKMEELTQVEEYLPSSTIAGNDEVGEPVADEETDAHEVLP